MPHLLKLDDCVKQKNLNFLMDTIYEAPMYTCANALRHDLECHKMFFDT